MKLTIAALFLTAPAALLAVTGMETVVKTDSGWVAGSGTTIRSYKGIPYAAPRNIRSAAHSRCPCRARRRKRIASA
jgi:hypothetical protein